MKIAYLLAASVLALGGGVAAAKEKAPVVKTSGGTVQGKKERAADSFYAIPFAKPPVGELRWRAPEPAPSWAGTRDATRPSASCMQPARPADNKPFGQEFLSQAPFSEDCLYLNVWTPEKRKPKMPVFVWIHGGGYTSGSGILPIYNGARLAEQGIVVVTINYRLGTFGFLAHPELSAESPDGLSGNYGLQDMVAALQWVKKNAASFGGDPQNVTIAGQSAGAMAVHQLIRTSTAKGLFQKAIAQSGSGFGFGDQTLEMAQKSGASFLAPLAPSIAAARKLSAEQILANKGSGPVMFTPNVDGKLLVAGMGDPAAGIVSNVPFMTGYTADEFGRGREATSQSFEQNVRKSFGAFADRVLAVYPHATDAESSASADALARDRYMIGQINFSEKRAAANKLPMYGYIFDHAYPGPYAAKFGAFHTAEVPYVFGVLDQPGINPAAVDHDIAKKMQTYWINFFRSGNPNGAGLTSWPDARENKANVLWIGDKPGYRLGISSPERLSVLRDYLASGGKVSVF